MASVYVVGTFDTKGQELGYVRDLVAAAGQPVTAVDVGTARTAAGTASTYPPARSRRAIRTVWRQCSATIAARR